MRKNLLLLTAILSLLVSCKNEQPKGANGVTYKSAVQYNDYIVSRQTTLMKRVMEFAKMSQRDLDSAEMLLDAYVKETGTMVTDLKGMPPFKGDSSLRDAAVRTFSFYKKIFDKDYRDVVHLRKEQDGTSQEIEDRILEIVKSMEEEEKEIDTRFQDAQKKFAKKNNMKLVESELQKELEDKLKTEN